jgi:endonuclease/exonuclease/phosphatase (EEP) superfamily protein YafD
METEKEKRVNWDIPKCGAYTAYRSHDGTFLEIKASDLAVLKIYAQEAKARIEELEKQAEKHQKDLLFLDNLIVCGVDNWGGYGEAIRKTFKEEDK